MIVSLQLLVLTITKVRLASVYYTVDHPSVIGGPGIEVEINESKFGKRKYNRGRQVIGHKVFGEIE